MSDIYFLLLIARRKNHLMIILFCPTVHAKGSFQERLPKIISIITLFPIFILIIIIITIIIIIKT